MIQINLASRKSSRVVGGGGENALPSNFSDLQAKLMGGISGLKGGAFEDLKALPLVKVIGCVVIAFAANVGISYYQGVDLAKLDDDIARVQVDKKKVEDDLKTTKAFDGIRQSLEADEATIRAKVEVIDKLIRDRQRAYQVLLALSTLTPQDVWLQEFSINETEAHFRGQALGFLQVSDFMRNLNESTDFADVKPGATTTGREEGTGIDVTNFDLTARRR